MKGLIFDIKRYSVNDGPGIRVTVFLKGCPLSCQWCHNPEGINPEPEEVTRIDSVGEIEFVRKETAGRWYEAEDVVKEVLRDSVFINESGGGVTFSGGEPLLQPDFLYELLKKCRERGLHTAVDTSGQVPWEDIHRIIPFTSLFLFDLKHAHSDLHKLYTGSPNELILSNLKMLAETGATIWLRIPVIGGVNTDEKNVIETSKIISELNHGRITKICLLPYHKGGTSKNSCLEVKRDNRIFKSPGKDELMKIKDILAGTGISIKTGG